MTESREGTPGAGGVSDRNETGWRCLAPALAVTVALRVAVIAAACVLAKISWSEVALLHDGWEYLRMSDALAHFHPRDTGLENVRLFPGYPLAIALLGLGEFPIAAGFSISILGAAACGWLTARLGRDKALVWWMVALTPSWLLHTSVVMSEALSTLMALTGLALCLRRQWAWAGLVAGFGIVVRPVGAFLFIPLLIEALAERNRRAVIAILLAGAPLPILYLVFSRIYWGSAVQSVRDYSTIAGNVWPFQDLVMDSLSASVSLMKKGLVWGTLAIAAIGGCGLWKQWRGGDLTIRPLLAWHLSAGLFYLLSPGNWMFDSIDRYYVAIWPTALIGLAPWLPRRRAALIGALVVTGAISIAITLRWLTGMAAVFPFEARAF